MNCRICQFELTRGRIGYMCESCGTRYSFEEIEDEVWKDWEKDAIQNYPSPIAIPFQKMLQKEDPTARVKLLVDTYTNVSKLLCLVVLTDYIRSPLRNQSINDCIDKLTNPLISAWRNFLCITLPILKEKSIPLTIPEIHPYFDSLELNISKKDRFKREKGFYNDLGEFVPTTGELGLFMAMVSYRNSFSHKFEPPPEIAIQDFALYYTVFEKILRSLDFLKEYQFFANQNGNAILLKGTEPFPTGENLSMLDPYEVSIFVRDRNKKTTALSPLFIHGNIAIAESLEGKLGKSHHLLYENYTGNRILYQSPDGYEIDTTVTVRHWQKLLSSKKINLSPIQKKSFSQESLDERIKSHSQKRIEELYQQQNLIPGIYLRRKMAEAKITSFLEHSPYPLAFLTARGGAGKTNLLGRFTEIHLTKYPILFMHSGDIRESSTEDWIESTLGLEKGFLSETLPEDFLIRILLDALNEKNESEEFLNQVINLVRKFPKHFKILISYRQDPGGVLPKAKDDSIHEIIYPGGSDSQEEKEGLEKYSIELDALNHLELKEIWDLYTKSKSKFSPKFGLDQIEAKNRNFLESLKNPLTLRIFTTIYHEKNIPEDLTDKTLWESYLVHLDEKKNGSRSFLYQLAERLLEIRSRQDSYDNLILHPDLGKEFRNNQIDSIFHFLKERMGVLVWKKEKEGFSIRLAIEPFLDYLIGEVLISRGLSGDSLKKLYSENIFPPIERGISYYLTHCIQISEYQIVADFIDILEENGITISAVAIAEAIQFHPQLTNRDWELFQTLLNEETKYDLKVILLVSSILEDNFNWELSIEVLRYFVDHAKSRNWEYVELLVTLGNKSQLSIDMKYKLFKNALDIVSDIKSKPSEESYFYSSYGIFQISKGEFDKAKEFHTKALDIRLKLLGERHSSVANSYNNLGNVYALKGEFDKAFDYLEKSLQLRISILGERHPQVADSYDNLGIDFFSRGEFDKAKEFHTKALDIRLKSLGKNHPDVADTYNNLGNVFSSKGEFDKAFDYYEKSLNIRISILGENHPQVADLYHNLGIDFSSKGEFDKAKEFHTKALDIRLKSLGKNHPDVAYSYYNLGISYSSIGEYDIAIDYYKESLNLGLKIFGETHPDVANSYQNLGGCYFYKGEFYKAKYYFDKAIEIQKNFLSLDHPDMIALINNYTLAKSNLEETN
ncbi:MAG: tetratricopeptide repeat protein [Leptospiraceae bacterium]|nr:tetratricopeptide repeat protein [Leptospiraceae bacterium]